MSSTPYKYVSYEVTDRGVYDEFAKSSLMGILLVLEKETDVRWSCGKLPSASLPEESAFHLAYNIPHKTLFYVSQADLPENFYWSLDIAFSVDEYSKFINFVKNDLGNKVYVEPVKEASHWNAVCVCGADAYDDGFKYECKSNCGSKVPKDKRS